VFSLTKKESDGTFHSFTKGNLEAKLRISKAVANENFPERNS
jgi:hypothetical protein